jgi:1-acyl-sn-glycerol-3-phosphate acyltransferase
LIASPLLTIVNYFYFGLKVKNKKVLKKLRKSGAVTICNHVHYLDSAICALSLFPRKPIITSIPSNFSLGLVRTLVEFLGAVPTPATYRETMTFLYALSKDLRKGYLVHFFPEGELVKYETGIREFKRGAFYLAVDAQMPILPMKIIYREPRGLYKLFKKKSPCLTLVIGEPLYPNCNMLENDAIQDIQKRAENLMNTLAG